MQVLTFETGEMMSLIMEIKRVLIEGDLLQPERRSSRSFLCLGYRMENCMRKS